MLIPEDDIRAGKRLLRAAGVYAPALCRVAVGMLGTVGTLDTLVTLVAVAVIDEGGRDHCSVDRRGKLGNCSGADILDHGTTPNTRRSWQSHPGASLPQRLQRTGRRVA